MGKKIDIDEKIDVTTDDARNKTGPNNDPESKDVNDESTANETTPVEDGAAGPDDKAATSDTDPLTTITVERDALKDQLLRALADTENMRRRSEREVETARKYGHTRFARDLVAVIDNLARALESAPADKSSLDESVQSLLTGIELSWNEFQTVIEKHGVQQINPFGEKFDYNLHQAMYEVPTDDQPPGMVLEVVQHGYVLHDRLLRPAMVGVSKAVDPTPSVKEENN